MALCALTLILSGSGCGSGIVGAVLSGQDDNPAPLPPALSLGADEAEGPLAPQVVPSLPSISVRNYQAPSTADIQVLLRAPVGPGGAMVTDHQDLPSVQFGDANATTVRFIYNNNEIRKAVGDLTVADVPAEMVVEVGGVEVAPPIPFLLLRQPKAELDPPLPLRKFVSTLGLDRIRLRVSSLRGFVNDLQMRVKTINPGQGNGEGPFLLLTATDLRQEEIPGSSDLIISAVVPASSYPAPSEVSVFNESTGQSTFVDRMYYTPAITGSAPVTGPSSGGTLVGVAGKGLLPFDFQDLTKGADLASPQLDFSNIKLFIRKGGREALVSRNAVREDLSNLDLLVFTMPPSPDGLSGAADLVLQVEITGFELGQSPPEPRVTLRAEAEDFFSYGGTQTYFGPRGVVLPPMTSDFAFGNISQALPTRKDMVVVSTGATGIAELHLLVSRGNGLFSSFGPPTVAVDTLDQQQRFPRDLCIRDMDGDGDEDVFILNAGVAGGASHSIVLANGSSGVDGFFSNPPWSLSDSSPVRSLEDSKLCALADLDSDVLPELMILAGDAASSSPLTLFKNLSVGGDSVQYFALPFSAVPGSFQSFAISDLDGDGLQDVMLAHAGDSPTDMVRVGLAFGAGGGTFTDAQNLSLNVPLYQPDANSQVVGLSACGATNPRCVAIVLSGVQDVAATPPTLIVLRSSIDFPRNYDTLPASDVLTFSPSEVFHDATFGDLDGDGAVDLVLAKRGSLPPQESLLISPWQDGFSSFSGNVDLGAESLGTVRGLSVQDLGPARALLVDHEVTVQGALERRVSTFLHSEDNGVDLLPADASQILGTPVSGLISGPFSFTSSPEPQLQELYLALTTQASQDVQLLHMTNDGLGSFSADASQVVDAMLPSTLTAIDLYEVDDKELPKFGAFLTQTGELGVVVPEPQRSILWAGVDLRQYAPQALQSRLLNANSRMTSCDVDGDGLQDLVIMLGLALAQELGSADETVLLFMPGLPRPAFNEPVVFPFALPSDPLGSATTLHGNATSLALGNFIPIGPGASQEESLELAVAIPQGTQGSQANTDGNFVQFFSFVGERFVLAQGVGSSSNVLLAGERPRQLAVSDFDANGSDDLAVAAGDGSLRVFLNFADPGLPGRVSLDSFVLAPRSPMASPVGVPRFLRQADLNGDGLPDLVLGTEQFGVNIQIDVTYFLNPGLPDNIQSPGIPKLRTGDQVIRNGVQEARNGRLFMDVGDVNGDAAPDLILGWNTSGPGDRNLRVLFNNDL